MVPLTTLMELCHTNTGTNGLIFPRPLFKSHRSSSFSLVDVGDLHHKQNL